MKPINSIILLLIFLVAIFFIYQLINTGQIDKISPEEAKKNMELNPEIILLDVRTVEEYREKNIPGSFLIPLNSLKNNVEKEIPDKNTIIYVYCRTGSRSSTAVGILNKIGYTNVFNLGGIYDWPYETN